MPSTPQNSYPPEAPKPGLLAWVRQRHYLIEEVIEPPQPGDATLVTLSCVDPDAQGRRIQVMWELEPDARHGHPPMTRPGGADAIVPERNNLGFVAQVLSQRARDHAAGDPAVQDALRLNVWNAVASLLDAWENVSAEQQKDSVRMKYWQYEGDQSAWLLRDYLDPELEALQPTHWKRRFRAKWSMRDVEPPVAVAVLGPGTAELDED